MHIPAHMPCSLPSTHHATISACTGHFHHHRSGMWLMEEGGEHRGLQFCFLTQLTMILSGMPESVNPLPTALQENTAEDTGGKVQSPSNATCQRSCTHFHSVEMGGETGAGMGSRGKKISILELSRLWLRFGLWLSGTWAHPCFCHIALCYPTNHCLTVQSK